MKRRSEENNPDRFFARLPRNDSKVNLAILAVVGVLLAAICVFGGWSIMALFDWFSEQGVKATANDPRQIVDATMTAINLSPTSQQALTTTAPVVPTLAALLSPYPTQVFRPSDVDVEGLLATMSLEEKVGQMLLSGFSGQAASGQAQTLINQYYLGGIVYFGDNTRSPGQVLALSQDLQRLAQPNPHPVPLLISIDHEGGRIFRFQSGMTHFSSAMSLGATNSPDLVYNIAAANAWELLAAGINTSLGPVLDINDDPANLVIGLRAFGGRADLVTLMGERYIAGLQEHGMIAAAKHFPGHGSTDVDSHSSLPVVNKSLEQLQQNELLPFAQAVRSGVGIIMVGHIANRVLDPSGLPASLSPVFIQDLLRGQMAYDGVIMTDALTMGAVTESYDIPGAAVKAVQAGVDIVAVTGPDFAGGAHAAILQAIRSGAISQERVDQSVRRILLLKAQYGLFEDFVPQGGDIAYEADGALARQAAQAAVTLYGGELPSLSSGDAVLVVSPSAISPGQTPNDNLSLLGEFLTLHGIRVDEWIYPLDNPSQVAAVQQQVLQVLPMYPKVLLVTYDARLRLVNQADPAQKKLLEAVLGNNLVLTRQVSAIVVAASSPYDLALLPPGQPGLAIFGVLDIQIEALVNTLMGDLTPSGIMPVMVSGQ